MSSPCHYFDITLIATPYSMNMPSPNKHSMQIQYSHSSITGNMLVPFSQRLIWFLHCLPSIFIECFCFVIMLISPQLDEMQCNSVARLQFTSQSPHGRLYQRCQNKWAKFHPKIIPTSFPPDAILMCGLINGELCKRRLQEMKLGK